MSRHQDPGMDETQMRTAAKQMLAAINRKDPKSMVDITRQLWKDEIHRRPHITDGIFDAFPDETERKILLSGLEQGFVLGHGYGMQLMQRIAELNAEDDER